MRGAQKVADLELLNAINFSLILVISGALIYWTLQLLKFDKSGEENKDVTAHSFL